MQNPGEENNQEKQQENPVVDSSVQNAASEGAQQVEVTPVTEPPRRRGRPPKNPVLEAETPGAVSAKSASAPKKRAAKIDGDLLAKQLVGIHMMAATMSGIPECGISEDEGKLMATAITGVASHYNLDLDGKTGAFIQLMGVAAMIYLPRFAHFRNRVASNHPPANAQPQ